MRSMASRIYRKLLRRDRVEIRQIYDRYRELLRTNQPPIGRILKTDCFNEGVGDFRDLGDILDPNRTTYLEIDVTAIEKAVAAHPDWDFRAGDIRKLPFDDLTFNTIFDLSTVDHVPPSDLNTVLGEYHRVLKYNGKLVMVAWCADERRDEPVDWGGLQYFFYEPDIMAAMSGFSLYHRDVIHRGDGVYLAEFIARKT